jgi:hypothetical protein
MPKGWCLHPINSRPGQKVPSQQPGTNDIVYTKDFWGNIISGFEPPSRTPEQWDKMMRQKVLDAEAAEARQRARAELFTRSQKP